MNMDSSDFECTNLFSAGGRLQQVEYAAEAASNSGTAIGMKGNDGVVFAAEKISAEPLLETTGDCYTFSIDRHIGAVVAGLMPDARNIINAARIKAVDYRNTYASPVPLNHMMQKICTYLHEHTLQSHLRPFGVNLIVGSFIPDGPRLYRIQPSGAFDSFIGCAIGKAADAAMSEMEKIDIKNASIAELTKEAAKIIYAVHDNQSVFELELSWCGEITDGNHEPVPPDVLKEAQCYASEEQNSSSSDSDDDI